MSQQSKTPSSNFAASSTDGRSEAPQPKSVPGAVTRGRPHPEATEDESPRLNVSTARPVPRTSNGTRRARDRSTASEILGAEMEAKKLGLVVAKESEQADAQRDNALCTEVRVRLPKAYNVNLDIEGATTSLQGEIDRIPWRDSLRAVEGLRAAYANTVGLALDQIRLTPTLEVRADQAIAEFVLFFPSILCAQASAACDAAAEGFVQSLRGQDDELTGQLFEGEHDAAVAAGRLAAMDVRRSSGANLQQELHVDRLSSPGQNSLTIATRIGEHPDPMSDAVADSVSGLVVGINTRRRIIELERSVEPDEFQLVGSPDERQPSGLVHVAFALSELGRVLKLPLGRNERKTLDISRSVGRGGEKLTLLPRPQGAS